MSAAGFAVVFVVSLDRAPKDVEVAEMPTPFSEIFVEPFVVGGLAVARNEVEEVMVLDSEVGFARKLKGEEFVGAGLVLKPEKELNALLVVP